MNKKIDENQLYRAAIKVFARYGFSRTRMGDVSAALDLAAGTIYRYVSDKKDLYQKTVEFGLREWQAAGINAMASCDDPLEKLVALVLTGFQYLKAEKDLLSIMVETPDFLTTSPKEDPYSHIHRESVTLVKEILAAGIEQKRFRSINTDRVAESFFTIYMLYIIKIFIKKEGKNTWETVMTGIEIILQGIIHRTVDEDLPAKFLEKYQALTEIR